MDSLRQNAQSERSREIEAFILGGGVGSRMGREKHLLELDGVPVIVRTLQLVQPLVKKITVIGPTHLRLPSEVLVVGDLDYGLPTQSGKSKSPLFGIATALFHSRSPWNLILACDLPYLSREWLVLLLSHAERSNAQIVMPCTSGGAQPLAAIYRRECGPAIVESLRNGVRKVKDTLAQFSIEAWLESDWKQLDPEGIILKSMNTPADYEEARKWWDAKESREIASSCTGESLREKQT